MKLQVRRIIRTILLFVSTTMFLASTAGWFVLKQTDLHGWCQSTLVGNHSISCISLINDNERITILLWHAQLTLFTSTEVRIDLRDNLRNERVSISVEYRNAQAKPAWQWVLGWFRIGIWDVDSWASRRDIESLEYRINRPLSTEELKYHNTTNPYTAFIVLPMWFLPILFGAYPLITFLRGPVCRWRRRRRNLCIHCGYNLMGNTTGRCPECGAFHSLNQTQNDALPATK